MDYKTYELYSVDVRTPFKNSDIFKSSMIVYISKNGLSKELLKKLNMIIKFNENEEDDSIVCDVPVYYNGKYFDYIKKIESLIILNNYSQIN